MDRALLGGIVAASVALGPAEAQAPSSERPMEVGGAYVSNVQNSSRNVSTEIQPSLSWLKLVVPVSLGSGNALLLGASYEGQFVSYSNIQSVGAATQPDLPTTLHAVDALAGVSWKLGEAWSTVALFTPGLHSDFKDITNRDWIWAGHLLFLRPFGNENRHGDRNRIGFGAAFSDRFGDPLPFPLVLLDWYPSEDWFVKGTLPLDLDAGYRLSRSFSVGLGGLLKGYTYRLTDSAPWFGAVIRYREFQLGPFLDVALTQALHLRASGGASVGKHFEFRDESNSRTLADGDFESGGFFRGALYIGL